MVGLGPKAPPSRKGMYTIAIEIPFTFSPDYRKHPVWWGHGACGYCSTSRHSSRYFDVRDDDSYNSPRSCCWHPPSHPSTHPQHLFVLSLIRSLHHHPSPSLTGRWRIQSFWTTECATRLVRWPASPELPQTKGFAQALSWASANHPALSCKTLSHLSDNPPPYPQLSSSPTTTFAINKLASTVPVGLSALQLFVLTATLPTPCLPLFAFCLEESCASVLRTLLFCDTLIRKCSTSGGAGLLS
ncbi:hypothetical protein LZ32DRAFT_18335 [Colletotrichum eremochloae]|nr:hypothetical protein LZ32DRAFT_18335 [Colletotrichum eremochloae]